MNRRAVIAGGIAMTATPALALPASGALAVPYVPPMEGAEPLPGYMPHDQAELVAHVQSIGRILQASAPGHVRGVSWMTDGDGLPRLDSIWATAYVSEARGGLWGYLSHSRPAVYPGWRSSRKAMREEVEA